ncbi:MAG TPA: ABC transporter substrate-binding protein [Syntrophales bacterium]|nr:ABC transporter substrate-binding protein [Syntrophales bacterium]HOL58753.1 ABC transporter substrate-binding protein [Syntrophales bacterium]HPO34959.1 ABC transporter substrate-binding protein [Syntrophales bacterium]
MKNIGRGKFIGTIVLAVGLIICFSVPSLAAKAKMESIVIGYVGNVASPGTKPCMDIQKMAVEEINAKGGILGRPVVYKIQDGKGDSSLSVEALRKLVIEDKAIMVSVEGRTEICLAVQEASAMLVKEYPHILVFNGPMGAELTARILDQAPKYDHCFRSFDPEPGRYSQMKYFFSNIFPKVYKAKKLAILWEDLAWTTEWRKGISYLNLPTWEKLAQDCGIQVVYSKLVKPRGTMYFPVLQQVAAAKAELIFYVSSWFTDTESFAKQWADSAAKDIPPFLYGGVSQTQAFWQMTGGKALGILSEYTDFFDLPVTPQTIPLVKKARERNIPMQEHVHLAYADIYHFKDAVEKAKGVGNLSKLIKAMEEVATPYSLGKLKYETQKIKPFYRSMMRVLPTDPYKSYPGYFHQINVQFQQNGKVVYLNEGCPENEPAMRKFLHPELYRKPADLRKAQ